MVEDCEHGSDPYCCVVCGPASKPDEPDHDIGPVFLARYDGRCAGPCRGEVEVRDPLQMVDGRPWCMDCVGSL